MVKKNKNKNQNKESKGVNDELTDSQRSALANRIRIQMMSIESDGIVLESMEGIKKLNIMLSLFEKAGKEFDTCIPLKELDNRYLEVRLRNNKNKQSVVVIKNGNLPA